MDSHYSDENMIEILTTNRNAKLYFCSPYYELILTEKPLVVLKIEVGATSLFGEQ